MSVRSRFAVDVGAMVENPVRTVKLGLKYALGLAISVWMLFPIYWMVMTSLQPRDLIRNMPPNFLFVPTFTNYVDLFVEDTYHLFLFNSLVVSVTVVALSLVIAIPAAYSLSRLDVPGGHHFAFYILSTRMVPPLAIIVPLFVFYQRVGLANTRPGLIIVHFLLTLPLMIWIIKGFVDEVPESLEESAMVSGCTRLQAFREVTLPLIAPGVTAAAFIAFIFSWNDFQLALVLVDGSRRTAPLVIQSAMGYLEIDWGQLGAAGTVTVLPVIIVSLLIRNYLVEGMTMGAVKE
jgi:multiple sugar transport system permease protein